MFCLALNKAYLLKVFELWVLCIIASKFIQVSVPVQGVKNWRVQLTLFGVSIYYYDSKSPNKFH